MVAQRDKCSITFSFKFLLNGIYDLLKGRGNFFLTDPRIVVSSAIASPEQIRVFRSNLVNLVENVLKCVLRNVTGVWVVGRRAPLACFDWTFTSFRLYPTAVSQTTVSCCTNLVLSIEVCIRKMDKSYPLPLTERLFFILLVNETPCVRGHAAQNECDIFFERNWFVKFGANFNSLRAEVIWCEYELSKSWYETLSVEVVSS